MEKCLQNKCVRISIQALRWVPVLFITAVVIWGYYAYVFQLCISLVENIVVQCVYLVILHILLFFFLWSYYQTVFAPIGSVPNLFVITQEVKDDLCAAVDESEYRNILGRFVRQSKIPIANRAFEGGPRFCLKCSVIKPDRSHHCSVCSQCVLKFDHHCPWVNTCINFRNYKFFVLFLGYGFYLCVFVFFSILPYFVEFWKRNDITGSGIGKFHVLFLFFLSGMFGISLGCLFFYHLYLTCKNKSTLETFRPPIFSYGVDKNAYNLGVKRNFQEIFGQNLLLWMFPIFTSRGDGVNFKTGGVHREKYDLLLHSTSEDSDDDDLDAIEFVGPQLV